MAVVAVEAAPPDPLQVCCASIERVRVTVHDLSGAPGWGAGAPLATANDTAVMVESLFAPVFALKNFYTL